MMNALDRMRRQYIYIQEEQRFYPHPLPKFHYPYRHPDKICPFNPSKKDVKTI